MIGRKKEVMNDYCFCFVFFLFLSRFVDDDDDNGMVFDADG